MDMQPASMVTWSDIQDFVQKVLAQHRLATEPNIFHDGNEETLSVFSELQCFLRSGDLKGVGPVQEQFLPVEVKKVGNEMKLVFLENIPTYATQATIVHRDRPKQVESVEPGSKPEIKLNYPDEVIAVKLSDDKQVRLVTFVTHAENPLG
ncbi:hypothetical protein AB0H49_33195 [Nocardia sp. NPDC050713]|uniref:hypothetical protein n=1 Tax=Nocardia sp. NPDC050713 TaxID=3154511 RepID=UPI0033CF8499